MTEKPIAIRFTEVSRHFGAVKAVDAVNLEIYDGEFFSMLGPSGSGKTTCLRMIAGFEQPSAGRIYLYDQEVSRLPPYERDVNTVFQDYALFPHMSVEKNVAYGLMIKKVPKQVRQQRVQEMLKMVRLPAMGSRKPSQLSGGQRQRVALARALINRPRVLLLDEPLGALDLKLRQEMQSELKAIQQQVGITFVYVTHDQEEALTMSDRIAVFNHGKIEQVGTPSQIYENPQTSFVAGFVGTSNLLSGAVAERITGSPQMVALRPEKVRLCEVGTPIPPDYHGANGVIRELVYLGVNTRYVVALEGGGEIMALQQNLEGGHSEVIATRDQRVTVMWQKVHLHPVREGA